MPESSSHAALDPNDGIAKFVHPARGAESPFVRKQMLAQSVPLLRRAMPERKNNRICQREYALQRSANCAALFIIPNRGMGALPPCLPKALDLLQHRSLYLFIMRGYGAQPHGCPSPLTFRLTMPHRPFAAKHSKRAGLLPACPPLAIIAAPISLKLSPRTGGFSRFWGCRKSPQKSPARRYSPHP